MDPWISNKLTAKNIPTSNKTVIDCGCGDGSNSISFALLGANVTAIDIKSACTDTVDKKSTSLGVKVHTVTSPITRLNIMQQFDIVLFTHVLHFIHTDKKKSCIEKVLNLTRPGGILFFADLVDDGAINKKWLHLITKSLRDIETESIEILDAPHPGANFPHTHKAFYLMGIKK